MPDALGRLIIWLLKCVTDVRQAVVDRLIFKESIRVRLADSIETALKIGEGTLTVMFQEASDEWVDVVYSEKFACTKHPESSLEEL